MCLKVAKSEENQEKSSQHVSNDHHPYAGARVDVTAYLRPAHTTSMTH